MPDLEGTSSWWAGRVTVVQQRLQDHVTGTLAEQANAFFQQTLATLQALEAVPPSISARLHLEIGMQHHVHGRERVAKSSYEKAAEAHEFSFHLMGAQGRRTKHQIFSVNHLVVDVESKAAAAGQTEAVTPARLELNDEILLEQITIDADQPAAATEVKKLHPIDQCILLAVCQDITDSNPEDALSSEQQKPFVRRVQESPQNWSVHTQALLIQARLESHKSRTVERAALQVQALVDQMVLDEPAAPERLEYIFCLAAPTRWELSRELGQRFVSIGAVRSGLEIFERLAMFEDMISCHQMLGETDQAKKLVQDLLAKSPTNPKYMCLMGDLEQDPSWWQQSWDASKGSFSRAMRALGSYHFREARFEEAVRCYKEAMRINPLFSNSWFIMGCAALRYDDWDEAANAFMRCVQIDADNGEAWTNLASTRLRQGRKRDAWHALREALRQQYDSFKIWENYLYVSVDLKEWQEALRAMQRIFELRWDKVTVDTAKKHVIDVEPSCVDSSVDAATMHAQKKQKALKLVQTMQALMAKIVNKIPTAPPLWIVLANFHEALGHAGRALECWRKVWRILINQPAVDSDDAVFTNAVRLGIAYCKALQRLGPVKEPARMAANQDEDPEATDGETTPEAAWTPVCADWMTQRKMAFRKLLALGRQNFDGSEIYTELEEAASAS
ncbi:TPR-like protein [Caulochytrium protostelioides]|uniref:TPR-like protein n=1 Tax=Caulochytrium protostelioides TaxID=1555241 RepID=A0A4P9X0Q9_9FUNG|nr:TPR-like protein [Caulochytrium protostelioides]